MSRTKTMQQQRVELDSVIGMILDEARKQGATAAEAGVSKDSGLSVSVRKGEVETIEHNNDQGVGLSVYFGRAKGSASTSDLSPQAIRDTVRAACNIARHTTEDPCNGLADADLMASDYPDLDLYHPWEIPVEEAIDIAVRCEAAALAVDPRIDNSEGASLNSNSGLQLYGNSHGFLGGYPSSRHSLSCAVVGSEDGKMQRDYWYSSSRIASELEAATSIGRKAGERTLARLGARRIPTCQAPVIFQAEMAVSLVRSLLGAIRGSSLYRKSSFLLDQLGERIFPDFLEITEDPLIPRGLASAPFDAEGVATRKKTIIQDGILQTYLLSSYSARKLGMQTTGNAGGVRNILLKSSDLDLEGLMHQMGRGLLITEMMGHGLNVVTGDYSRGATGFWVENGEIQYPVEEITIAGNLRDVFSQLLMVANDVEQRGSIRTGSWLIESMTIAGT